MTKEKIYKASSFHRKSSLITAGTGQQTFEQQYKHSIHNGDEFWKQHGKRIDWIKPYHKIKNVSFSGDIHIRWFYDGSLNACANCIDRHLQKKATQPAIIWEGDDPAECKTISYQQLFHMVCKFANALKDMGAKKGTVVTLYMPMIPETAVAMLACARIGAIHSVVFAGFSPDSLAKRINDCDSPIIITADQGLRGGKIIPLKENTDKAVAKTSTIKKVIVVKRTGSAVPWNEQQDVWYHDIYEHAAANCPAEEMNAEDPLFILYTSGSTGKPKGVVHTTGGYMVYTSLTHQAIFDYVDGEVYWCGADFGWITGHSYVLYGPLANGATTLIFEGVPNFPDPSRYWQIIDKHQVNLFYTAPTIIRSLMKAGDDYVTKYSRKSLRVLATVGEPINPEAWEWYYRVVGDKRCPVIDTWWQTETGGIMIAPLAGITDLKPGSATKPFLGIQPCVVNAEGEELTAPCEGNLCIKNAWPGMMRGIYKNPQRFAEIYFSAYKGMYFTGDGCRVDADGYYWISGRVDDVINVSGHRLGTAEIESALTSHEKVAEAAVVGFPHDIKGQAIYAYVTLKNKPQAEETLKKELIDWVKTIIGAIAAPEIIQWAKELPKTRSGKIMRRILRKIAANEQQQLGDTSTLAEPQVIEDLVNHRIATE